MANNLLDDDLAKPDYIHQKYRPIPLVLELLPLFVGVIGVLFKNENLMTVGFCTAAAFYTFLSWYFFKAEKFKIFDVIFAFIFGNGISVIMLGLLFHFQQWEGAREMITAAGLTVIMCFSGALVYFLIKRLLVENKAAEFTMSLKILSRYTFLFLLFLVLDLFYVFREMMAQ